MQARGSGSSPQWYPARLPAVGKAYSCHVMSGLGNTLPARVGKKFLDDQGPRWAVLIAWNGLFAIFPIALALATLIGLVVRGNRTLSDKLYSAVVSVLHGPETQW